MKHGNCFYLELPRTIFTEEYSYLSVGARWLYVVLNELEQRFTGKDCDFFFRTDADLAADAGVSLATLKRYKAELRDSGLVQIWVGHLAYENGRRSEKKFTYYRVL